MATGAKHWEQDKEATVYVGNLDERVTDALVWELMLQAGRIVNVHLPKDRVTQTHQGYGFVEFISEDDAEYAAKIMNQVRLYGKPIRVNKASADKQKTVDVGAELFVGNLDGMVDEKGLYDTFSRFGTLVVPPKIARDESNISKGYGFVSFSNFESSDEAIANMHGQFLANKEITVQYAYKKDGKGERHGDAAERLLAAQAREHNVEVPTQQGMQGMFNPGMSGANGIPLGGAVQAPQTPVGGQGYGGPPQGFAGPPLGFAPPPQAAYGQAPQGYPPQQQFRPGPQNTPLPPAPAGLPARPPPSMVGYGGPPTFGQGPPGFQQPGPPGFQQPAPPGFGPPGQAPPGFGPPAGSPVGMPPGFQPPGR